MKDSKEVITDFNSYVNMTADELEGWLKSDDSNSAGWPKEEGEEGGETVGHDSGRKIVEILRANPQKKADKYTEDQIQHMRKVAAYCKRHLAQETAGNKEKSAEDVKKTKSYASLRNWGHDFLKAQGKEGSASTSKGKKSGGSKEKQEEEKEADKEEEAEDDEEEEEQDQEEEKADKAKTSQAKNGKAKNGSAKSGKAQKDNAKDDKEEEHTGDKRKTRSGQQPQSNPIKKRETRKGAAAKKSKKDEKEEEEAEKDGDDKEEENAEQEEEEDDSKGNKSNGKSKGGKKAKNGPEPGDTVSWNWGGGKPSGKVLDVKGEETSITTKRGNQVSRKGKPEDPAVVLDTGKSKAIKSAHELN